jgi:acyl carrier protein
MTQLEIEVLLIKAIASIQEQSGRPHVEIGSDMIPFDDLEGFDSINGVEVTVDIMEQMQIELKFNNVFALDDKALTIKAAAERICETLKEK